ncbi:MAG: hypothetical protein KGM47_03180 [Acidobacteriota bacterium]|nr:hypothetical protein [Acidobacteriota bacterium]
MLLGMHWALAVVALGSTGYVLRRILRLDEPRQAGPSIARLTQPLEKIYHPVAEEIETQTVILGVTLNDALGAVHSGHAETALAHVCLATGQVELLSRSALIILSSIAKYYPEASAVAHTRVLTPRHFQSRAMIDFMENGGKLHQFIFRSKPRFLFHVQVIQQTLETLSRDFKASYNACELSPESSPAMWGEIAPVYHDFDLMVKEALLAFRSFLPALPDSSLPAFSAEIIKRMSQASVRSKRGIGPWTSTGADCVTRNAPSDDLRKGFSK